MSFQEIIDEQSNGHQPSSDISSFDDLASVNLNESLMRDESVDSQASTFKESPPNWLLKIKKSYFCYSERNATITTFVLLIVFGILFGLVTPPNDDLSSGYRYFSNCIGYTYFLAWSISFYPQIILNYYRKTTVGSFR